MSEQRRPALRIRHGSVEMAKRFDELIDVPMRYWAEAGHQWRRQVMATREELKRMIGEVEDAWRSETQVGGGRTGE